MPEIIKFRLAVFTAVLLTVSINSRAAGFADSIISYNTGVDFATDFGTGAGLTNAASALGEPSRSTGGAFPGPVDPFSPAYLGEEVVSIGAGGSLTVHLSNPAVNDPANPFGIDFIVFGNAGFVITNGNYSGGGITDGSLFGADDFKTKVSVSPDNVNYYELAGSLAPVVDGYYPTDGTGNFFLPVNPNLTKSSFSGKDLTGIRQLYGGSGGGTGYDLGWARDAQGNPVALGAINYIRVDVLSGTSEIDGFTVVPEPGAVLLASLGAAVLLLRKRK